MAFKVPSGFILTQYESCQLLAEVELLRAELIEARRVLVMCRDQLREHNVKYHHRTPETFFAAIDAAMEKK